MKWYKIKTLRGKTKDTTSFEWITVSEETRKLFSDSFIFGQKEFDSFEEAYYCKSNVS